MPPGSAVETLGCIPMAPAFSWIWLLGTPLHPIYTASPRRHQIDEPPDPQAGASSSTARRRPRQRHRRRDDADQDPALLCLPGNRSPYVDDLRRFVPFVLEASGRLGIAAGAFLEYLRTLCHFPILRFGALVSVISVRMALRWVRYLRHPI